MQNRKFEKLPVALAVGLALAAWQPQADAQNYQAGAVAAPTMPQSTTDGEQEDAIEEVVVMGRHVSASQQLVNERMNDAFSTDVLDSDTISRLGDSTVGSALRRIPGLTLVQDKFVYIRGLGERYSQSTLNGAQIPSPDLTRNVIPLDVFPTSVVEALKVQKSWSPSLSANFGGGAVAIRTKGIPDGFVYGFEAGIGANSANPDRVNTYDGGSDDALGVDDGTRALSSEISSGVASYQGNPSVQNILMFQQRQDPASSLFDAETENLRFATALNRDIAVKETSSEPDYGLKAFIGNRWDLGNEWNVGAAVGGSYDAAWRYSETLTADFGLPEEQKGVRKESTRRTNIAGTLNLGVGFLDDHEISTTTLFLRNTDDETEIFDFFNENRPASGSIGFRDYRMQFEERNMTVNQIRGSHYLGADTRNKFAGIDTVLGWLPEDTVFNWFWSTATATTDIPNQVEVASEVGLDANNNVVSENVRLGSSSGDFRFTDLEDQVDNYGWSGMVPIQTDNWYIELSGGYEHAKKARIYEQSQFSLGFLEVEDLSVLEGPLDVVFGDNNLLGTNTAGTEYTNNAVFDRQGANTNSYLAATMTDGVWGQIDATLNDTWRAAIGLRWEDYRQAALNWNPWGYSATDPQVTNDIDELQDAVFEEDRIYPSIGLTYMGELWAETFQLRFGYSETTVRPDLREITDASYIDPVTDDLVRGNSGVVPSDVTNFELRAEWFFGNGDNFTVTGFHKDITNPIEFFEIPASDTTIAREIINADSATVSGIEIEALKELGFLGGYFDTLFVQGNATLQDSELVAGEAANSPTNPTRSLTGASDYVLNLMLGFDSPNAAHTASLIYNVFGERLFVAGRNGAPDGYEQPFHSLDFTYFWYPTDTITLKVKAKNLLGEKIEIQRQGVTTFLEDPGSTFSISFQWAVN